MKKAVSAERIRELLHYDAETGHFTWVQDRAHNAGAGSRAGTQVKNGAIHIGVDGRVYLAHRLVWLWVFGAAAPGAVDHINGIRSDNRLSNLRVATGSQNCGNTVLNRANRSGYRGVSWSNSRQKWIARIQSKGFSEYLGEFDSPEEAAAVYNAAAVKAFGRFFSVRTRAGDGAASQK